MRERSINDKILKIGKIFDFHARRMMGNMDDKELAFLYECSNDEKEDNGGRSMIIKLKLRTSKTLVKA